MPGLGDLRPTSRCRKVAWPKPAAEGIDRPLTGRRDHLGADRAIGASEEDLDRPGQGRLDVDLEAAGGLVRLNARAGTAWRAAGGYPGPAPYACLGSEAQIAAWAQGEAAAGDNLDVELSEDVATEHGQVPRYGRHEALLLQLGGAELDVSCVHAIGAERSRRAAERVLGKLLRLETELAGCALGDGRDDRAVSSIIFKGRPLTRTVIVSTPFAKGSSGTDETSVPSGHGCTPRVTTPRSHEISQGIRDSTD